MNMNTSNVLVTTTISSILWGFYTHSILFGVASLATLISLFFIGFAVISESK